MSEDNKKAADYTPSTATPEQLFDNSSVTRKTTNLNNRTAREQQAYEFLRTLYPTDLPGYLTIWTAPDGKTRFYAVNDTGIEQAAKEAIQLSNNSKLSAYFGVGLREKRLASGRGKSKDVTVLPDIYMDIDVLGGVHSEEGLPTPEQASDFIKGLPLQPSVMVMSGGGYHLHWCFETPWVFEHDDERQQAQALLRRFHGVIKRMAVAKEWKVDNVSDLARVLRPPGTINRKDPANPVTVTAEYSGQRYNVDQISAMLANLEKEFPPSDSDNLQEERTDAPAGTGGFEDFERLKTAYPPAYAANILSGCAQMAYAKENAASLSEPMWRAQLSIFAHTEEGREFCHELSGPHGGYSSEETNKKIDNIGGPYTCATIQEHGDPDLCAGCPLFGKGKSPISLGMKPPELTDLGNADRFVRQHGDKVRYCHKAKNWMTFDGARWQSDEKDQVIGFAKQTARNILHEQEWTDNDEKKKQIAKHAIKTQSARSIQAMLYLAQSVPKVAVLPNEFDTDKWKLNVKNGVLDLKTRTLLPHSPDLYMRKLAPVAYDLQATCPTWEKFLDTIFTGDMQLIGYMQRLIGWTLTGDTREELIHFFFGDGSNGKSVLFKILYTLLGDYALQIPAQTLMNKKSAGIPNDIAALQGARFVAAAETKEDMRLDEGLVKQLTGRDPVTARFLHKEFFTFQPEFKLWMATNHKPKIIGTDNGIWRRVRLIPFTVIIPEEQQDKELEDKLRKELPGILNWSLKGCLQWQQEGLNPPASIMQATKEYRDEMDALGQFLDERCTMNPNVKSLASALYESYANWCDVMGEYKLSANAFGRRLKTRPGIEPAKMGRNKDAGYKGIDILKTPSNIREVDPAGRKRRIDRLM